MASTYTYMAHVNLSGRQHVPARAYTCSESSKTSKRSAALECVFSDTMSRPIPDDSVLFGFDQGRARPSHTKRKRVGTVGTKMDRVRLIAIVTIAIVTAVTPNQNPIPLPPRKA